MARYDITYDTGQGQSVEAARIERDDDEYVAWSESDGPVAYIPARSVLSIIRSDFRAVSG